MTYTLNPAIRDIIVTPITGYDSETTGLYPWHGDKLDLIQLSNQHENIYVLEVDKYSREDIIELLTSLSQVKIVGHNIKFDSNFVLHWYGILFKDIHCTQDAARLIDNGRQKQLDFDLLSTTKRYLPQAKITDAKEKKAMRTYFINPVVRKSLSQLPAIRARQLQYAAEDVEFLIPLYHEQLAIIHEKGLKTVYDEESRLTPVLSAMEVRGVLIDKNSWLKLVKETWTPQLKEIETRLDEEAKRLLQAGYKITGRTDGVVQPAGSGLRTKTDFHNAIQDRLGVETRADKRFIRGNGTKSIKQFDLWHTGTIVECGSPLDSINYASSDQLLNLWNDFGEPVPTDQEGKQSVEESTITTYLTENPRSRLGDFIEILLEYREIAKLISTYGESFLAKLDKNNRIHTEYTQTRTETGRLSSKNPNLQNIPNSNHPDLVIRLSRDIRRFFIADPDYAFITCDMEAAEVRIAADYSGEPLLIDALERGVDMHSDLAAVSFSIIFKQPIQVANTKETISIDGYSYALKDLRQDHKRVLFAKFYKAGARRVYSVLAKYINRHHPASAREDIAQQISNALDLRMPVLSKYLTGIIKKAQKQLFLVSTSFGRIRYFPATVYGEAANYPIQGTNAEAIKVALLNSAKYLNTTGLGYLAMNVHDELGAVVKRDFVSLECRENPALKIKEIMSDALGWFLKRIKGGASVSVDTKWRK